MADMLEQLLASDEPSVRWKARRAQARCDPLRVREDAALREEIRASARARALLSERDREGRIPSHPYAKWAGAHWVLATLADLGYPARDASLVPLREQVLEWLLDPARFRPRKAHDEPYRAPILFVNGRTRAHASLEGNALYALATLGLEDERCGELARRLCEWQWPDGGWNCDRTPSASHSSFHETLIPLRGLVAWASRAKDAQARAAVGKAVEYFLRRRLMLRLSDGKPIDKRFLLLHYPCYWHYDVLFGLKVMREAGHLADARCEAALSLLRSRQREDGGFVADERFWAPRGSTSRRSLVDWGPTSKARPNPFVTADALLVLSGV